MTPHATLTRAIRLAVRETAVLWPNASGVAHHRDGSVVRYGLCVGSSDLIGVALGGRFLALELKTPRDRLRPEQRLFLDLVTKLGGIARVVRSVDDALAAVEEARR